MSIQGPGVSSNPQTVTEREGSTELEIVNQKKEIVICLEDKTASRLVPEGQGNQPLRR